MAKRLFDLSVAALALLLLAPILAGIALAVRLVLGRPALFRQARPGRGELPFTMYKFRTMRDTADARGSLLPDAERLHPFGNFLRHLSLDELPELWNVLKGEMSLVGPRPLLMEYLPRYSDTQRRRHEVKPGMTGWAQIHGRNQLSWERKFEYDVWYVEHHNFRLDLEILAGTVRQVIGRDGINRPGHATAPKFQGTTQ